MSNDGDNVLSAASKGMLDRIKHPLLGSITIFSLLFNWDSVLTAFSGGPVEGKILLIKEYFQWYDALLPPLVGVLVAGLTVLVVEQYLRFVTRREHELEEWKERERVLLDQRLESYRASQEYTVKREEIKVLYDKIAVVQTEVNRSQSVIENYARVHEGTSTVLEVLAMLRAIAKLRKDSTNPAAEPWFEAVHDFELKLNYAVTKIRDGELERTTDLSEVFSDQLSRMKQAKK